MSTAPTPVYEWKTLPWTQIERQVFKLQKRIYRASQRGDTKTVHRLQRLLLKSWSARCLATRKITQDNQGKKTAGIDGVRTLTPAQRLTLVHTLQFGTPPPPTRRVWIPKPGSSEQRPLGIPTIHTRVEQTLVKFALEPEWEAKFEPHSYGFRPGRSCHDAIEAIFTTINQKPKYVLDADIAKCFDRIDHRTLLDKLHTTPTLRRIIHAWLKAGVLEGATLYPTDAGTPQGGPLSPLLMNVALHGLETALRQAFPTTKHTTSGKEKWQPTVIRYADDLVILHPDLTVIEACQQRTSAWLAELGLELKPSKTRITHTLTPHHTNLGFDFLGFHIRQYPTGKTHSGSRGGYGRASEKLGFKTLIMPSKDAQKRHTAALRTILQRGRALTPTALIHQLNPVIHGWATYYATVASKQTFSRMGAILYTQLWSWARRRHPNKPRSWIAGTYWHCHTGNWSFRTNQTTLASHAQTPIQRYIKVKGTRSPYDGDWTYWSTRQGRHPAAPRGVARLLKRQRGRCPWCGLYFRDGDSIERDHITPQCQGGTHRQDNLQLLHRHCHDDKTARDGSLVKRRTQEGQMVEEPDEAKVSRPVLKPGGGGDPAA